MSDEKTGHSLYANDHVSPESGSPDMGYPLRQARALYCASIVQYDQKYGKKTLRELMNEINNKIESAARGGKKYTTLRTQVLDEGPIKDKTPPMVDDQGLRKTLEVLYPGYGIDVTRTDGVVFPNPQGTPAFTTLDIFIKWY